MRRDGERGGWKSCAERLLETPTPSLRASATMLQGEVAEWGTRPGLMCVPSCCYRERLSWHTNAWETHRGKVAGFQNSAVYLQQRSQERGEPIPQTACGCQVYRPGLRPGQDEPGASPLPPASPPPAPRRDPTGAWTGLLGDGRAGGGGVSGGHRAQCPASPHLCDLALFRSWLSWSGNTGLFVAPATVEPRGTAEVGVGLWHLLRICCSALLPFLTGFSAFLQMARFSGRWGWPGM